MSRPRRVAAVAAVAFAAWSAPSLAAPDSGPLPAPPANAMVFAPPDESTIPETPLGDIIRFGKDVFVNTQRYAAPWVGNGLNCVNCHLDAGRKAGSGPLWAAYVAYPAFRDKTRQVNTFAERLDGCFRYSMNGRMPPLDSEVIVALTAYSFWLATGAPVGAHLAGRGFPAVPAAALPPDATRGREVFVTHCASCHGRHGQGLRVGATYAMPPVWGRHSYNGGAGMHQVSTAAAFIKANMPFGQGNTLTDQQAWDVATFINAQPRPRDPRLKPGAAKAP
jgi:thiosulfate dehydrogenase